ncbi:sterol desaturase family protein [Halomonas sp. AOP13-D3-9]
MMDWFWTLMLVIAAFLSMEVFAWYAHKYIMHGWGWRWHKSHHEPTEGVFEKNDLYVVVFSLVVVGMFAVGDLYWKPLMAIASGITLYGVAYSLFHDGMVHQRWPIRWQPKSGYLKRLVQAHRIHHAVRTREGAVSFGFLYAPDVRKLKKRLQHKRAAPPAGARHDR